MKISCTVIDNWTKEAGKAMERELEGILRQAAAEVRQEAQKGMLETAARLGRDRGSDSGGYPNIRTGTLMNSVAYRIKKGEGVIYSRARHAWQVAEKNHRPFLQLALRDADPVIKREFGKITRRPL